MKSPRARAVVMVAGLVLVGAMAAAWLAYERDLRAARERVASGSQVIATRCGLGDGAPASAAGLQ